MSISCRRVNRSVNFSCLLILVFVWRYPLFANTLPHASERSKIALVLAGGGAKGAAHIGVLQALEALRVPVDFITGTSMGAYVGGMYATGKSASEVKLIVDGINWEDGYRDRVDRSYRRVRDKEFEDRYQINTDLGIRWIQIRVPKGVVQGQNMLRILRNSVGGVPELSSFDRLAIPFRAVATDIVALKPVILDHGFLVDAMMASMSVPGVLPPYKIGDQLLVDGGVTNNMPVSVARNMGADIVIAVDISTDYKQKKDFTDFLTVADQLSNFLVRQSTQQQENLLSGQDIYLHPEVGDMETTDFGRMEEAYQKGYDAVMAHKAEFALLSLSISDYQRYIGKKQQRTKALKATNVWVFDQIRLDNQTHYSDAVLKALLKIAPAQVFTKASVEERINNLYAFDRFELIHYQIKEELGKTVLVVSVREKSWGPNYVHFHLSLEDDFNTKSQYSAGISTNFTGLDSRGSELRVDLEMGTERKLAAEYYFPITQTQNFFSTLSAEYLKGEWSVPYYESVDIDTAVKDYLPVTHLTFGAKAALGYRYRLWDEFKFGIFYKHGNAHLSTFASQGSVAFERLGVFGRYRLDTLDDIALPSHGLFLNVDFHFSNDMMDNHQGTIASSYNDTIYEYSLTMIGATTTGRHTLVGNFEYGEIESQDSVRPIIEPKTIGGLLHLSGIAKNSLSGQNKAFASLIYRYRCFDNNFGLFTAPVYIGTSFEYGGVWSDPSLDYHNAPLYAAGSLFAGVDSPIGPVMLGYGRTEHNLDSVYLTVGHDL